MLQTLNIQNIESNYITLNCQVKKEAEEKVGMVFQMYNAIEYQTQVVAGTNFKILVSTGVVL